ncbi:putative gustatory receptor 59e [Rhagoletis pomonella]|uniref:putative gustatory receptor 59e n=1 Tax=Rhagoletis pomonella TaxID=28610 RepID=UPI001783CCC2|nr:putative gustatory receptor 59e [Rhagoletis pomonella]
MAPPASTINKATDFAPAHHRTYTNFNKADWNGFAEVTELYGSCIRYIMMFLCLKYFHVEYQFYELMRGVGAHNLPSFLLSLKLGQYWLCLRFACLLYKRFNEALKQRLGTRHNVLRSSSRLEESSECSRKFESHVAYVTEFAWYKREFCNSYSDICSDYEILEFIRRLYADLDALMEQVANVFGFILLLHFLGSLFALSIYVFEIYKSFHTSEPGKILWQLQHLARIFLILIANNAIVEEKCRTPLVLNEIKISTEDMEHAINRFLLQMMARKPTEMACGVVELDLLLLTGILCTVTNCVMFLIQIDLSNNSFEKMNNDFVTANNTN